MSLFTYAHFFVLHRAVKTSLRARVWKYWSSPSNPSLLCGKVPLDDICVWSSIYTWAWLERGRSSKFDGFQYYKVFLTCKIDILILFIQILVLGGLQKKSFIEIFQSQDASVRVGPIAQCFVCLLLDLVGNRRVLPRLCALCTLKCLGLHSCMRWPCVSDPPILKPCVFPLLVPLSLVSLSWTIVFVRLTVYCVLFTVFTGSLHCAFWNLVLYLAPLLVQRNAVHILDQIALPVLLIKLLAWLTTP